MAKVLSDRTAEWLKNQINSRNISSHQRPRAPISTNASGGSSAIVATVVSHIGGGVYLIEYEKTPGQKDTLTTAPALLLANNLVSSAEYSTGDLILVHRHEIEIVPGGEE